MKGLMMSDHQPPKELNKAAANFLKVLVEYSKGDEKTEAEQHAAYNKSITMVNTVVLGLVHSLIEDHNFLNEVDLISEELRTRARQMQESIRDGSLDL